MSAAIRSERRFSVIPSREAWAWIAIVLVALAVRWVSAVHWHRSTLATDQSALQASEVYELPFGDSDSYLYLGSQIAHGKPYRYRSPHAAVFRSPGYPLLIAAVVNITSDDRPIWCVRLLNVMLGSLTVGLVGLSARLLGGMAVGLATGIIAALYPGAIATSVFILAEAPFCFWMMLAYASYLWGRPSLVSDGEYPTGAGTRHAGSFLRAANATRTWILAAVFVGLATALALLTRPSGLLFATCCLIGVVVAGQSRRAILYVVLVSMVVAFTYAPWIIRNQRVTGHAVVTTLQTGASLYDGWHAGATGESDMSFVAQQRREFLSQSHIADAAQVERSSPPQQPNRNLEFEFDRFLRHRSIEWARQHPTQVFRLSLIKLKKLWTPWPQAQVVQGSLRVNLFAVGYLFVMLLSGVGLFAWRRRIRIALLCIAPSLYVTALHVVFPSSVRYREPAMLLLLILAGAGVVQLLRWCRLVR